MKRLRNLIVSGCLALTLTGCAVFGTNPSLPPLGPRYEQCFNATVKQPPKGAMSQAKVVALIAALKSSDVSKTRCGKDLIRHWETFRN